MIKSGDALHLVEYSEEDGAFIGTNPSFPIDKATGKPLYTGLRDWWIKKRGKEVIGNIHDNPELLRS